MTMAGLRPRFGPRTSPIPSILATHYIAKTNLLPVIFIRIAR